MTDNVLLVICTSEIKVMKETYFPEINEMYQVTAGKLSLQFLPDYLPMHDYLQFPHVELLY
jgi:hypothetical protein